MAVVEGVNLYTTVKGNVLVANDDITTQIIALCHQARRSRKSLWDADHRGVPKTFQDVQTNKDSGGEDDTCALCEVPRLYKDSHRTVYCPSNFKTHPPGTHPQVYLKNK